MIVNKDKTNDSILGLNKLASDPETVKSIVKLGNLHPDKIPNGKPTDNSNSNSNSNPDKKE